MSPRYGPRRFGDRLPGCAATPQRRASCSCPPEATPLSAAHRVARSVDESLRPWSGGGSRDRERAARPPGSAAPPAPRRRTWRESGKRSASRDTNSSDNCSSKSTRTRSSRTAEGPTLPFGGVGQARPDVVPRQLRKVPNDLVFRHPARQVAEHVADGDAGPPDAGLAEPNVRVNRDALERTHTPSLRQLPRVARHGAIDPGAVVIGPTRGFSRGGS